MRGRLAFVVQQYGTLSLDRVRSDDNAIAAFAVSPNTGAHVVRTTVRDSQFAGSVNGMAVSTDTAGEAADVTIERSTFARSVGTGISALTSGGGTVAVAMSRSAPAENGLAGVYADGAGVTVFVEGSALTRNPVGLSQVNGATIYTYGNNALGGNGAPTSGVVTPISLQ